MVGLEFLVLGVLRVCKVLGRRIQECRFRDWGIAMIEKVIIINQLKMHKQGYMGHKNGQSMEQKKEYEMETGVVVWCRAR